MTNIIRISEAANLVIHAMIYMATNNKDGISSVSQMIQTMPDISPTHLSKALQRAVRGNLLISIRGAKGGFKFKKNPDEITFLEILTVVDGELTKGSCFLDTPVCKLSTCVFQELINSANELVEKRLGNISVLGFAKIIKNED